MTTPVDNRSGEGGAPLACQRAAFTIPDGVHFLNCAYMGPLPREAERAGVDALARKRVPTDIVPPSDFWAGSDTVRGLFAELIGASDPERIAIQPGASYGVASAAKNIRVSPGQNIVTASEQFPGNVYAWRRLATESGGEVRVARPVNGLARASAWNERLLASIDHDTAAVAVPSVHWTDGTVFDLEAVGRRCREVGAAFVVDATQSLGMTAFDLEAVRPDVLLSCTYKWLLGPYSVALAYFGPRFDQGVPIEETWIAREGSQDFRRLVEYRDTYRPGAVRYDVAERSNFFLLPIAEKCLRLMLGWGADRIEKYCSSVTRGPLTALSALGYGLEVERWRSAHLFGLRMPPGIDIETLQAELARRNISVSLRGSALRVSVHVYNDARDLDALVDVLTKAAPA